MEQVEKTKEEEKTKMRVEQIHCENPGLSKFQPISDPQIYLQRGCQYSTPSPGFNCGLMETVGQSKTPRDLDSKTIFLLNELMLKLF